MVGTTCFASLHALDGVTQSRHNDVESLVYVFIFLLRGSLPWQNLRSDDEVRARKSEVPPSILCDGFPDEFATMLQYTRSLQFTQQPDYAYIRSLLQTISARESYIGKHVFDWVSREVQCKPGDDERVMTEAAECQAEPEPLAPPPVRGHGRKSPLKARVGPSTRV